MDRGAEERNMSSAENDDTAPISNQQEVLKKPKEQTSIESTPDQSGSGKTTPNSPEGPAVQDDTPDLVPKFSRRKIPISLGGFSIRNSTLASKSSKPKIRAGGKQKDCDDGDVIVEDEEADGDRETWGKKVDFLLSVIGFAVDLANVWRFPYLCYKNGGGAFLIPYCLMLVLGGIPLFFMELALGQYNRTGAITCWGRLVPLFKGIGFAVVSIAFFVDFFYNVILAWSLRYFLSSFTSELPWTHCNNSWNSPNCRELSRNASEEAAIGANLTVDLSQAEVGLAFATNASTNITHYSPAHEYFYREVLQLHESTGFGDLGVLKWDLSLCLLAVYLICYFSVWKGISTSGKVVYFTAIFPYVVLGILLIRGVTLPGAADGVAYYLKPDFSKISTPQVWVDAATQIFFSLGPGFGVLLAFASYNKFHNNVYKDALVTSCINCCTSFVSGFVIFSVLGYMAHTTGDPIDEVADEGPGLVFVVYPSAIATMPGSSFWSLMFFLMLLTLGLDSSFAGSEAVITALSDEFPVIARNRERFVACLFTFDFLVGLLCCTQGGYYVFRVLEEYAAGFSILFAVFWEAIAVSWIYGLDRLCSDVRQMIGFAPGLYWRLCLKFFAPLMIGGVFINGLIDYEPLSAKEPDVFSWKADTIGWLMAAASMIFIPGVAIFGIVRGTGTCCERVCHLCVPLRDDQPRRQTKGSSVVLSASNGVRTETRTQGEEEGQSV